MITNNWLVNKVFCGLARLFITEKGLEFPAELSAELSAEALAAIDRAESPIDALNTRVDADKNSFTGAAVRKLIESAHECGLKRSLYPEAVSWISEQRGPYKIKLEIFKFETAQDQTCASLQVIGTETNTLFIEACYWQPNDGTPMLTASAYLHPRVQHLTIPEGIRLGLIQADRNYGGYAIQNLCDWWEAKHGQ